MSDDTTKTERLVQTEAPQTFATVAEAKAWQAERNAALAKILAAAKAAPGSESVS